MIKNWLKTLTNDINTSDGKTFAQQIKCPRTGLLLFKKKRGHDEIIRSYGTCPNCNQDIHVSELHVHTPLRSDFPMAYEGIWCNICWESSDIPQDEEETF